ncbi:glycosyltransferase family A protein [Bacillus sp. N9]
MLNNVSVIMPISLNDKPREQAFQWVKKYYETMLPEVELCIGTSNEQPFPKAKVINKAVESSKGDILVIADADIFFCPSLLEQSIKHLETHAWVIPFKKY